MRRYGPLYDLFGDAVTAAVLDQALIVGNMSQTIQMLAESTGMDISLIKASMKKLVKLGLVRRFHKKGRTATYSFKVQTDLYHLIIFATDLSLRARK